MGFEITRVYKEHFPALRLIGKRYTNADRGANGTFGNRWDEWCQNGWFAELAKLGSSDQVDNGALGLITHRSGHQGMGHDEFAYWIGLFFPAGTAVPDGFDHLDLPESDIGMAWIRSDDRTGEIFGHAPAAAAHSQLVAQGNIRFRENIGDEKMTVCFERYNNPRFDTRDAGDIVGSVAH